MRHVVFMLGLLLGMLSGTRLAAQQKKPDYSFFESKIRPVLIDNCYKCHSVEAQQDKKLRGNLFLDSRAGVLKGGDNGPAIVPGQPNKSLLLKALRHEGPKMPRDKKLSDAVIADFEKWILQGAPDPRDGNTAIVKQIDWDTARKFWSFQVPKKYPVPKVKDAAWPKREIDFFLLATMETRDLKPVRPAGKLELIRRATFDLIGLPPTPQEIEAFLKDDSPDAFAKVVDRLLASPHYGERWGRYWLDVARYAEDKALAMSQPRPHSWRYRDWVVKAYNDDMPYERFLQLQLAGDLLPEPPDTFTRLAGLGFQGLGAEYHRGNFPAQVMADELDDRIDTLTRGLLGLTVACARCHDHKYDPIPTVDYYSLAAAYQGSNLVELPLSPPDIVKRFQDWQAEMKKKEEQLKQLKPGVDPKKQETLKAELEKLKSSPPPAPTMIHGIQGGGKAMRVNIRGNVEKLGELAPPGFLRLLPVTFAKPAPGTFTRLDLARAVTAPDNPLTARVYVNRVWQHHFGRGIVATTSNFGKLGEPPTHPELLDALAVRFLASGQSTKWLHREIMLSAAYQLSSASDAGNEDKDVDNHYLWRMTPHRLDLEAWRDALLAVSGRLDLKLGGPSFDLNDAKSTRRTLYAKVSRAVPNTMATLFDFPDANVTSEQRPVTTVPQQQLFVLNSPLMVESAKAFAARLEKAENDPAKRIALAYRLTYGRAPEAAELQKVMTFIQAVNAAQNQLTGWEQFAQALLASNEFYWVD
jgi:hypothetical protein